MRLPNVFTAMADVAMGFLFTDEAFQPLLTFILLLITSSCFYIAGMVLNDCFDVEQDRRERPQRPIPSGRISRVGFFRLGGQLFFSGSGRDVVENSGT